jgi:pyruvate-formate lyase-activating enzyme
MNSAIVLPNVKKPTEVDLETIKDYVEKNQEKWVMISGGEPLVSSGISLFENLLDEIRSWGCKIGLSTNGTCPDKLASIIDKVNYVTMDFKTADKSIYEKITITKTPFENLLGSLDLLRREKSNRSDFDYEIRTTLYPSYVKEIDEIEKLLLPDELWVLQPYRHTREMLNQQEAMKEEETTMEELERLLKRFNNRLIKGRYV